MISSRQCIAAWATLPKFRVAVIVVTLVVGIFGPTANGDRFALFQIVLATLASTVIVAVLMALTYRRLPWRALPDPDPDPAGENNTPPSGDPTSPPARPAPRSDAYAESP